MEPSSSERDPVEELAEEFMERYRRGERPALREYLDRYPHWAERIRALFPTLLVMEKVRPEASEASDQAGAAAARPERLGDYRILREVGRGGMGVVYEAEQESLGRHVALKVLTAHPQLDPRRLQRFRREARAVARLHHTNIVPVHGVGEENGLHYYVMQFIPGLGLDAVLVELRRLRHIKQFPAEGAAGAADAARSLLTGQFLAPGKEGAEALVTGAEVPAPPKTTEAVRPGSSSTLHLPGQPEGSAPSGSGREYWRSVARIGAQVAAALAYAAGQGVLHRDVKPSNLLLDAHGGVWLTDFGLAKTTEDADNLTESGDVVGTLRYLAPERFQGKADARSDLYALGLTLYELLTLRPAFDETSRDKLVAQVLHAEPSPPRRLDPAVPRDLETIVLKAMTRDPARRYPTGEELAEDLQRFLADRPIRARRLGVLQRGWRWCRRNPVPAALGGAVLGLLLTLAVGSTAALWRLEKEQGQTRAQLTRAEKAEQEALDRVWDADLAQARAFRRTQEPGRRFRSLEALRDAARIRPTLELRNEAVASIPLVDLQVVRRWERRANAAVCFDARLERYALDDQGNVVVRRVADNQELTRLPRQIPGIVEMRFSLDGKYLGLRTSIRRDLGAAGLGPEERSVQVWDLDALRLVREVALRGGWDFRPDGGRFAVGSGKGDLREFALPSGEALKAQIVGEAGGVRLAYAPDGRRLAIASYLKQVLSCRVLDAESGKTLTTLATRVESDADPAWSPDGKLVAVPCEDYKVQIVVADTGRPLRVLDGRQQFTKACQFNRRGDLLACRDAKGSTHLWDPLGGKELVHAPSAFLGFGAADDLAYADSREFGVWQVAAGRECRTLHLDPVRFSSGDHEHWSLDIGPHRRWLTTGNAGGVRLWDLVSRGVAADLKLGQSDARFDRDDGTLLTMTSLRSFSRWPASVDAGGGRWILGPPQVLRDKVSKAASLSRNGRWFASSTDRECFIEKVGTPGPAACLRDGDVIWFDVSPNGRWIVTTGGTFSRTIKVWDAGSGQVVHSIPSAPLGRMEFSPDGRRLATASAGHAAQLWQVGSWQLEREWENAGGVTFNRDGTVLAITQVGDVRITLLDVARGSELATLIGQEESPISDFRSNPDGDMLAAACPRSRMIQVWDLRALRNCLKDINLDWEQPDYSPPSPTDAAAMAPIEVRVLPPPLAPEK